MQDYFQVSATVVIGVNYPDRIYPRPGLHPSLIPFYTRSTTLPAESIFMAWRTVYPHKIYPRRPLPLHVFNGTSFAADVEQAVAPTKWWPTYPSTIPRKTLPRALYPFYFLPPQGELLQIAARQSWKPRFPDRLVRARPRLEGGAFWTIPPFVPAEGIDCVELIDTSFGVPKLFGETFASPRLIDETFTIPKLIDEDLC